MINIVIKKATLNDIEQLQEIGRKTFVETFSELNTTENMNQYIKDSFSEEKINSELEDKNSEIYFAVLENKIIGYLKLNFGLSQTELKDEKATEIERIYVLKEFHGKNIGQALFEQAIKIAQQQKSNYIWLGVWEENPRAISFYKKNNFKEFDKHIFVLGTDAQTDIIMKLELK
jgi:ribosomal protein S18 acetylase RimI-like enzyme